MLAHTVFAAFGLSALLLTSALAFEVVKWAGAGYLIFLGARSLLERPALRPDQQSHSMQRGGLHRAFWQATLTDLLNPKVALFFLAFLPQFVHPDRGPVIAQFLILGLLFLALGLAWDVLLAVLAGRAGRWVAGRPWLAALQIKLSGAVLLALGVRLALARRDVAHTASDLAALAARSGDNSMRTDWQASRRDRWLPHLDHGEGSALPGR